MEIDQGLLTKVKNYLRISHTKLDDDVADSISACLADLRVCGVRNPSEDTEDVIDPLVLNAVKLYCKAEYTETRVRPQSTWSDITRSNPA